MKKTSLVLIINSIILYLFLSFVQWDMLWFKEIPHVHPIQRTLVFSMIILGEVGLYGIYKIIESETDN